MNDQFKIWYMKQFPTSHLDSGSAQSYSECWAAAQAANSAGEAPQPTGASTTIKCSCGDCRGFDTPVCPRTD